MKGFESARDEILEWVSEAIRVPVNEIDLTKPLDEVGLDSLDAVHLIATIESIIQKELPEDIIQRINSLNAIFDMMREKMAAA